MRSYINNYTCHKFSKRALTNYVCKEFRDAIEYHKIDKVVLNIHFGKYQYIVKVDFYSNSYFIGCGSFSLESSTFLYYFWK